ncbi:hypothetical protein METEAL_15400 [Mesoterricola silvestris]|uniref:Uncharacterized protein n=1 Tax=Mesoterricola silvestris TaxID=2927979 RepID=A0AA48K8J4_9BACT|nr:hypothetical protein METEAL_15400 [Mesoterricola silvestris]
MTALAITRIPSLAHPPAVFRLVVAEVYGRSFDGSPCYTHCWDDSESVTVLVGDPRLSTRPDPIRRAWNHLEAKWSRVSRRFPQTRAEQMEMFIAPGPFGFERGES